ncbi:MAG: lipid-A-disaccharide synthase N-terminal domain-containing protein [Planctomycetes bacterium]|nr:lipid-A-disaccharide synthase N-terminal domain-containing protein [Planctomycetota bacterium]
MFMLRFVVQWFASERRGRSYVPVAFWYFSLIGGLMTLAYAFLRQEPVFMLAQGLGISIYVRNLILIYSRRGRLRRRTQELADAAQTGRPASESTPEPATAGEHQAQSAPEAVPPVEAASRD